MSLTACSDVDSAFDNLLVPPDSEIVLPGTTSAAGPDLSADVAAQAAANVDYQINPNDVLLISIWKEPADDKEVRIPPDGIINYLGESFATNGLTAEDLERMITERLKERNKFLDPIVTVSFRDVAGYKIYVIGAVKKEGEFTLGSRVDVVQALSLAGGFTPFADQDNIMVLRRVNGEQKIIAVDYSAIERGEDLSTNIELESGDRVMVGD